MEVEQRDFSKFPEQVTVDPYDCVWISLAPRKRPTPLSGKLLPWIDWKLTGQLVRFLFLPEEARKLTFLPTLNRLNSPFIVLEPPGTWDAEAFEKNCRGLSLKRILYVKEGGGEAPKELLRVAHRENVTVVLGLEST